MQQPPRVVYAVAAVALLFVLGADSLQLMPVKRTCRVCRQEFVPADPSDVCRFHSGRWIGAERSKHYGQSGKSFQGVDYFWDCCDAEGQVDKGCCRGKHQSYDDEDSKYSFLLNRRKE
jgi:hypothetical protein